MEQVIIGGTSQGIHDTVPVYLHLHGAHNQSTTEAAGQQIASAPGKLKNLYVELVSAPGVGKSYDFTVRVNGSSVGCPTVHIHDNDTSGSDLVNEIVVAAGDLVCLESVPTGTPDTQPAPRYSVMFEGNVANESLILGGTIDTLRNNATEYNSIMGGQSWGTIARAYQVIPTAGSISHLYVKLSEDPGVDPSAFKFTLMIGAAAQALTCTITADDTTGSDVINSVAVAAGDLVSLRSEPLNAPSESPYVVWGMKFTATIDGESLILGGSSDALNVGVAEYNFITPGDNRNGWTATEADTYMLAQVTTLQKLYIELTAAPGDGKSYTFTSRVAGGAGNLSVVITGAAVTTGNDVANSDVLIAGNEVDILCTPNGTPAVAEACWGLVGYIEAPAAGLENKSANMGAKMVGIGLI